MIDLKGDDCQASDNQFVSKFWGAKVFSHRYVFIDNTPMFTHI